MPSQSCKDKRCIVLTDCTSALMRQASTCVEDLVVKSGSVDADVDETDWT